MRAHFGHYSRSTHARLEKVRAYCQIRGYYVLTDMAYDQWLDMLNKGILLAFKNEGSCKDFTMGREELLGPNELSQNRPAWGVNPEWVSGENC